MLHSTQTDISALPLSRRRHAWVSNRHRTHDVRSVADTPVPNPMPVQAEKGKPWSRGKHSRLVPLSALDIFTEDPAPGRPRRRSGQHGPTKLLTPTGCASVNGTSKQRRAYGRPRKPAAAAPLDAKPIVEGPPVAFPTLHVPWVCSPLADGIELAAPRMRSCSVPAGCVCVPLRRTATLYRRIMSCRVVSCCCCDVACLFRHPCWRERACAHDATDQSASSPNLWNAASPEAAVAAVSGAGRIRRRIQSAPLSRGGASGHIGEGSSSALCLLRGKAQALPF